MHVYVPVLRGAAGADQAGMRSETGQARGEQTKKQSGVKKPNEQIRN
jgi:hypothetical protein